MISLKSNKAKIYSEFSPQALPVKSVKPLNFCGLRLAKPLKTDIFISSQKTIKSIKKTRTIDEIQNGISGKIRSAMELSTKDIMRLIDHQLSSIKAEDIRQVIAKFPQKDEKLALKVLKKLTQFGNMQSLNPLVESAKKLSVIDMDNEKTIMFLDDHRASLSNGLNYLNNKNIFPKETPFEPCDLVGSYVIDESALQHLENDKSFLRKIKEGESKLIYPQGWINGINPYNQTDDMFEKVAKVLSDTKKLKENGLTEVQALSVAIDKPIKDRLENLGLLENLAVIENRTTKKLPTSVDTIVSQLKPVSISQKTLDKNLNLFGPENKQAALEVQARSMKIESPKSLSESLKKIHSEILKQNNNSLDGIYYLVPRECKSYGYVAMQYQLANKIPESKILYNKLAYDYKHFKLPPDCKKMVILDDVAISGNSFKIVIEGFKREFRDVDLVVAPVYVHNGTKPKLESIRLGDADIVTADCISAKECDTLTKSEYFSSLNRKSANMIENIAGYGGFSKDIKTNIVFPWMAPDNNNSFFSNVIAPFFTLNGQGVKRCCGDFKLYIDGPASPTDKIYTGVCFENGVLKTKN